MQFNNVQNSHWYFSSSVFFLWVCVFTQLHVHTTSPYSSGFDIPHLLRARHHGRCSLTCCMWGKWCSVVFVWADLRTVCFICVQEVESVLFVLLSFTCTYAVWSVCPLWLNDDGWFPVALLLEPDVLVLCAVMTLVGLIISLADNLRLQLLVGVG